MLALGCVGVLIAFGQELRFEGCNVALGGAFAAAAERVPPRSIDGL